MFGLHRNLSDISGNAIVYTYPRGNIDIICTCGGRFLLDGYVPSDNSMTRNVRLPGQSATGADAQRSMRRARAQVRRLALANDFSWFVTLTLSPERIDRYDEKLISRKLSTWCDNMVRRHGLRYILVPERHKDGAIHFHGFFAGSGLQLVDSGTMDMDGWGKPRKVADAEMRAMLLDDGARIVYNLPQWRYGFTTAVGLYGDYDAAVGYVCKYIGKDMGKSDDISIGQRVLGRWYYSGGDLRKPKKDVFILDYDRLKEKYGNDAAEIVVPGQTLLVVHTTAAIAMGDILGGKRVE